MSDILIKGMEIPKNCRDCPCFNGEYLYCRAKEGDDWSGENRPSDCPLVPVQPHGRLIDADEFLKRAIGTKCFRGEYALMLEELVGESTTIIPAEEGE